MQWYDTLPQKVTSAATRRNFIIRGVIFHKHLTFFKQCNYRLLFIYVHDTTGKFQFTDERKLRRIFIFKKK